MDNSGKSLLELEHGPLLADMGFVRISRTEGQRFACDVFENNSCRVAFTIFQHDGDNIFVAPHDAPLNLDQIVTCQAGWSLVQDICRDFYAEYFALVRDRPVPRREFAAIIDRALRRHASELFRQRPNNSFKPKPLRGSA
jgi:hypothetical protein